jgi:hypothetical protein
MTNLLGSSARVDFTLATFVLSFRYTVRSKIGRAPGSSWGFAGLPLWEREKKLRHASIQENLCGHSCEVAGGKVLVSYLQPEQ